MKESVTLKEPLQSPLVYKQYCSYFDLLLSFLIQRETGNGKHAIKKQIGINQLAHRYLRVDCIGINFLLLLLLQNKYN